MTISIQTTSSPTINQSIALALSADLKVPLSAGQLTPAKRINEQEGYAVLAHQSLASSNPKLAARFEQELKQATAQYKKNHGGVNLFKVADRLIRQYVRERSLSPEQYRTVRDSAFGRSQLDSERTMLSSERSPNAKDGDTPVRALSTFYKKIETNQPATEEEIAQFRAHEAKISAQKWREKRANGSSLPPPEARIPSAEGTVTFAAVPPGFLWKPQSESDGKLVILLPSSMNATTVHSLSVIDPKNGSVIEAGRFAGIGNGARLHFRFSKSGASYPDGSMVLVNFSDGSSARISVADSSKRIE